MNRTIVKRGFSVFIVLIFVILCIFPIYWMVSSAFKSYSGLTSSDPNIIPREFSLDFFSTVINYTPFLKFLKNSLIVGIGTVLTNLLVGSMAAYSLSRLKFKGKRILARGILLTYVFPKMVIIIPLFVTIVKLRMLNTYTGLIITYVVFTFPFCVWMLTAFFNKIPRELEECASIDGATNFRIYFRIILPLSTPGLASAAIFTFLATWKEFLYAFLLLNSESKKTLTVGMYGFIGAEVMEWGDILAFNTLMIIPVIVFFLILQTSFIQGLTAGAVKG